jgi:hypothetical protein
LDNTGDLLRHPGALYPGLNLLDAFWDKALSVHVDEEGVQYIVPPGFIKVSVGDGIVTLDGRAFLAKIALVMERVSTMPGVAQVINHIKVRQDPAQSQALPNTNALGV